jgi:hypothetical protein
MGCGKRANPKTGIGAERMTNDEIRKFIRETAPADVAMMVDAAKTRDNLCVILSLFPEGRALTGDKRASSSSSSSGSGSLSDSVAQMLKGAKLVRGIMPERVSMTSGNPIKKRMKVRLDRRLGNVYNPRRYQTVPMNYRFMMRKEAMAKSGKMERLMRKQAAIDRLRRKPVKVTSGSSSDMSSNKFILESSSNGSKSGSSSKSLKNYGVNSGSNKGIKVRGGNLRSRPENLDPLHFGVLGGFNQNLFRYFKTPISQTRLLKNKPMRATRVNRLPMPSFYDERTGSKRTRVAHPWPGRMNPVTAEHRRLAQKELNRRKKVRRELTELGLGSSSSSGSNRDDRAREKLRQQKQNEDAKEYYKILDEIQKMHPVTVMKKRVRYHPKRWKGKWPKPGSAGPISNQALVFAMRNMMFKLSRANLLKKTPKMLYKNLAEKVGMSYENIKERKKIFKNLMSSAVEKGSRIPRTTKIMKILRRRKPKTYYNKMVVTKAPTLLRSSSSSGSSSSRTRYTSSSGKSSRSSS